MTGVAAHSAVPDAVRCRRARALSGAPPCARTTLFSRSYVGFRARSAAKSLEYVPARHSGISIGMEITDMHHAATEVFTAHAARPAAGEAALLVWLETARPGERFVYHVGHLAADRASAAGMQQELGRIADRVMALAAEGRVLPV